MKVSKTTEVVLKAVRNNGAALKYVADIFKDDREIVMEAVKNHGFSFSHTSKKFQNDKEIILAVLSGQSTKIEKFY